MLSGLLWSAWGAVGLGRQRPGLGDVDSCHAAVSVQRVLTVFAPLAMAGHGDSLHISRHGPYSGVYCAVDRQ